MFVVLLLPFFSANGVGDDMSMVHNDYLMQKKRGLFAFFE